MNPKTDELLTYLLWFTDLLMHPTYRNLESSFERWAYRNGFYQQLYRLERQGFLERKGGAAVRRIYKLSEKGRLHALGGCDPSRLWNRRWDGHWRMVIFDIARSHDTARRRLLRTLRVHGFGRLQDSVWITPQPLPREIRRLCGKGDDAGALIAMDARPAAGEGNAQIIQQAWPFGEINALYKRHLEILRGLPRPRTRDPKAGQSLRAWAKRERIAWAEAVQADPFLPTALHPRDYLGKKAWSRRQQTLRRAANCIRAFPDLRLG